MIIESIEITNFRQFCGENCLELSTDPNRNVTVVHGANGSGKTSLLNAFKWCFYGETDFDTSNDSILNEASIQGQKEGKFIELKIIVKFFHDNKKYGAIRTQRFKRIKGMEAESLEASQFALDVTEKDGQTKRSKSPFVELQSILPKDLQPYFFFNGERIEHIAGINQGFLIRDAIRKLMGLELVDRAVIHVDKAKKKYRKIVSSEVSYDQKNIYDLIQILEEDIKHNKDKIEVTKREEELARSEINKIERGLKRFEKSRDFQESRDILEKQIKNNDIELTNIKNRQKRLIDENGFLVISADMFISCNSLVNSYRKKGILPYGIKEQFIDDRIEMGECICGTTIRIDSKEHECLLDVRKTAGTDDQESTYTSVSALLKGHKEIVDHYKRDYSEAAIQLNNVSISNDEIRNEIDEISAQISHIDNKQIAKLEKDHNFQSKRRDDAISDKGIATNNNIEFKQKLDQYNKSLSRLNDQQTKQMVANQRMDKAILISETLSSLRDALSNQVRVDLSKRVDDTFQSIIRKPVRAIIDDDYCLRVVKKSSSGDEYVVNELSTGERQVTSLSFISSIIALAKEKHSQKTSFFQGGLYPLVMDSPFGSLDDDYREKVADSVSSLAEQVIIFVSNSQWAGKVKQALEGKVGKSYQLIYHSPKLKKGKEDDYTVTSSTGFEYSTLKEVS